MFASERLTWIWEGGHLRYTLSKPDQKGRTELILTPNSPWRKAVTARAGLPIGDAVATQAVEKAKDEPDTKQAAVRFGVSLWAMLIARIYEIFPLSCPIRRSVQQADGVGGIAHLHSLPRYYGMSVALWTGLPAIFLFAG